LNLAPAALFACALVAHAPSRAAEAKSFPSKAMRVIVTTSPGGGVDITKQ
jgi:tripartite-type tricarboxylate transporter receptor subunit TctC